MPMTDLKKLLYEEVSKTLTSDPVALLFSGGTDSLTILWTLLDLGAAVTCYTFHLSYFKSMDARASAIACKHWDVPQVFVTEDTRSIFDQLVDVISVIKSPRKTHVEVMYGYWFLLKAVKEQQVYSGIQADTLYGSNKNAAIQCGKVSASQFEAYRRKLLATDNQEGLAQARLVTASQKKILCTPYSSQPIRDFFFQYSWKQLNTPKQKMPALAAFQERFAEIPIYRKDDNMQCGSHLREHLAEFVKEYRWIYEHT